MVLKKYPNLRKNAREKKFKGLISFGEESVSGRKLDLDLLGVDVVDIDFLKGCLIFKKGYRERD